MTEEEMFNAVQNNDENYDGMFFYAVKQQVYFVVRHVNPKFLKEKMCVFLKKQMMPKKPDSGLARDAGVICLVMSL